MIFFLVQGIIVYVFSWNIYILHIFIYILYIYIYVYVFFVGVGQYLLEEKQWNSPKWLMK